MSMEGIIMRRERLSQDMQQVVMEEDMVVTVLATAEDIVDTVVDIMAKDLLSLDMAMVAVLDLMVDMDMEVVTVGVTVHMVDMVMAVEAMEEATMERERLDMVVMEGAMVEVTDLVMGEVMVLAIQ